MKLLGANIMRDGGSLTAFFRKDDSELLGIWLQVVPWDDPGAARHYLELRVSGDIRPEHGRVLIRQSVEEARLLADLEAWLAAPVYASEWSSAPGSEALEAVREIRAQADKRTA